MYQGVPEHTLYILPLRLIAQNFDFVQCHILKNTLLSLPLSTSINNFLR